MKKSARHEQESILEAYATIFQPVASMTPSTASFDATHTKDSCCRTPEDSDPSEVHMALSQVKQILEHASELLPILEQQASLEGWVAAKITKAADYLSSVYHWIDYDSAKDQQLVAAAPQQEPTEIFNMGAELTQ